MLQAALGAQSRTHGRPSSVRAALQAACEVAAPRRLPRRTGRDEDSEAESPQRGRSDAQGDAASKVAAPQRPQRVEQPTAKRQREAQDDADGEAAARRKKQREEPCARTTEVAAPGRTQRGGPGKVTVKSKCMLKQNPVAKGKLQVKCEVKGKLGVKHELVDLADFEDIIDLVNAWVHMRKARGGTVKRQPSGRLQPRAKLEPNMKHEPVVKKELAHEIVKFGRKAFHGIIDLTEGERRKQASPKKSSAKTRRPVAAPPSTSAKQASPNSRPQARTKNTSPCPQGAVTPVRRTLSKKVGQQSNTTRGQGCQANLEQQTAKVVPAVAAPNIVKRLHTVASTCAPQKLWAILQAAAQAPGRDGGISAALQAAYKVAVPPRRQVQSLAEEP